MMFTRAHAHEVCFSPSEEFQSNGSRREAPPCSASHRLASLAEKKFLETGHDGKPRRSARGLLLSQRRNSIESVTTESPAAGKESDCARARNRPVAHRRNWPIQSVIP